MRTIELNIGLSNSPLDVVDIVIALADRIQLGINDIKDFDIVDGSYNGEPEQTLVILGVTRFKESAVREVISLLALDLNQESIAYTLSGQGELVYAPCSCEERQEFDNNLFHTLQTFGQNTQTGALQNTGTKLNK